MNSTKCSLKYIKDEAKHYKWLSIADLKNLVIK